MPLLLAIVGLIFPRFLIFLLWFFTNWFTGVFETKLWPILGFLILPLTLLWYSVVINWFGGVWDWWSVLVLVLAALIDLGSDNGARR